MFALLTESVIKVCAHKIFIFSHHYGKKYRGQKLIFLRTVPPIVSAHPFCASRETLPRARPRVSPDAYSMLTSICKKYTPQRAVC